MRSSFLLAVFATILLTLASCGKQSENASFGETPAHSQTAPVAEDQSAIAPATQPVAEDQSATAQAPQPVAALQEEDPFPYTAVLSCGMNGFQNVNLLACLGGDVGTEIEITNGDEYGLYKAYNFPNKWQQTERGVEIPLSKNFSIKMQNSSASLIMGLRILDNQNNVLFQKQVGQWGVIQVAE